MKVTMMIPDREWYVLAGRAEKQGVRIADLVTAAVSSLVHDRPAVRVLRDQVQQLVEEGIPDPVISHRLRVPVAHVAKVRRGLGLKPVRFRRQHWDHELIPREAAS